MREKIEIRFLKLFERKKLSNKQLSIGKPDIMKIWIFCSFFYFEKKAGWIELFEMARVINTNCINGYKYWLWLLKMNDVDTKTEAKFITANIKTG